MNVTIFCPNPLYIGEDIWAQTPEICDRFISYPHFWLLIRIKTLPPIRFLELLHWVALLYDEVLLKMDQGLSAIP